MSRISRTVQFIPQVLRDTSLQGLPPKSQTNILPPVIRAIFVEDWDPDEPVLEFASDAKLLEEVRAVRREHNFSPPNAISAVSAALRRHVDQEAFDEVLSQLPAGAKHYWQVTESAA